jgi:transcriptional regulator GlxA family with amidase domain
VADAVVRRAVTMMAESLDDPPSISDVAARVGVDGRALTRRFRAALGRPPAAVQMALRLDRARDLLAETDMPAAAVAVACGFASPIWFSQAYAKRFGLPPGRHRTVLRAQGGAAAARSQKPPSTVGNRRSARGR